jgi:hypothetical protein
MPAPGAQALGNWISARRDKSQFPHSLIKMEAPHSLIKKALRDR